MKKLLIISAALVCMAGVAVAQPQGDGTHQHENGHRGRHQGQDFKGRPNLQLTEAQRQQLKTINEGYRQQLAALEANDKLPLGDYKKQLADLRKKHEAQVQGVFTAEQQKQLADFKTQREQNLQVRGAAHLEKLTLQLGLNDDQVAKIKAQQAQLHTQVKALHENSSLLPEQKQAQMQTLLAQEKDQLKTVLTPDQVAKLDSLHLQHPMRGGDGFRGGHRGRMAK